MKVVIFRYILLLLTAIIVSTFILKTAVDFNAEEPRCRVTQRKSGVLWENGKYENFSDGANLHPLGVACMVLQKWRLCVKKEPALLPNLG
jgi:hypothetical protein